MNISIYFQGNSITQKRTRKIVSVPLFIGFLCSCRKAFHDCQNNHFTADRSFHKFALADLFHCVTLRLCNEGCRLRAEIFDFLSSPYLRTAEEKSEIINHIYEEKRSFSTLYSKQLTSCVVFVFFVVYGYALMCALTFNTFRPFRHP